MSTRRDTQRLADAERRYRELFRAVADVGLVQGGSLVRRYTRCANPNCRCRGRTRPARTVRTGSGAPRSAARPSPDGCPNARRHSLRSGPPMTAGYVS